MTSTFMITISMFYLGILGIVMKRLHFLSALLCLELLLMSLFLSITMWSMKNNSTFTVPKNLMLLTLSACEASAGLSLMVALSRTHNSDLMSSTNMLQQ